MKLLAIDGNSIINRAFYGLRPLSTKSGFPTNAIFGFLSIMQRMVDELSPEALCVCFDRREKTFRHEAYEDYKAQRSPMPEELAVQIPKLKEVLDAMNIPRFELAGWEADDLLGTLSRRCEAEGGHCIIATGDKDSFQLITDKSYIYYVSTRMGKTSTREYDPAAFFEQYGFAPPGIVDLKALMGDASDNIPGVRGIGEKTGMDLITRFGSIEALYAALETAELKPAVRKKLEAGREAAQFSYELATIRCDAPMDFSLEACSRRAVNQSALYKLFLELEFHKLIEQMGLHAGQTEAGEAPVLFPIDCQYEHLTEPARLAELLALWEDCSYVNILTAAGLDAVVIDCMVDESHARAVFSHANENPCHNELLRALCSPSIRKCGHNIKDLQRALLAEGLDPQGFLFDTALAAYLLAPIDGSYELEKLSLTHLGSSLPSEKAFSSPEAFSPLSEPEAASAALFKHCACLGALYETLEPQLETLGMLSLYRQVELPLCRLLAEMELLGFSVDRAALSSFGDGLTSRIAEIETRVYELAGEKFNLNSTQQLGVILFDNLGLPAVKKTKTGYSTSIEVLEKLRGAHPIVEEMIAYRQLAKLNSTYVEGLVRAMGPDGRIHTSFQNTVTATGRLSSTEPNLQNIPVRTPLGAQMRRMFVAAPGKVLVDADYSQIELRLLAHIADDVDMQDAFTSGEDIHRKTAAQVFSVPLEEVTSEQRRSAKAVNFGIVYGISEFSLSQDIGVSRHEAAEYMEHYFEAFSGVRSYMHEIVQQAHRDGFVQTLYGRRRNLPELVAANFNMRAFGERVALNMPIQGTAADIMKIAMLRVDARLRREGLAGRLILQVHDELIVECPAEEAALVSALLEEEMAAAAELRVPLLAEAGIGHSWAEAKA